MYSRDHNRKPFMKISSGIWDPPISAEVYTQVYINCWPTLWFKGQSAHFHYNYILKIASLIWLISLARIQWLPTIVVHEDIGLDKSWVVEIDLLIFEGKNLKLVPQQIQLVLDIYLWPSNIGQSQCWLSQSKVPMDCFWWSWRHQDFSCSEPLMTNKLEQRYRTLITDVYNICNYMLCIHGNRSTCR